LFDINWFILEYIINCIGKCLQILICLVKLFAFLSLFIVFVLFFFSTVLVNKDEYNVLLACIAIVFSCQAIQCICMPSSLYQSSRYVLQISINSTNLLTILILAQLTSLNFDETACAPL